jgi:hypothetical protein
LGLLEKRVYGEFRGNETLLPQRDGCVEIELTRLHDAAGRRVCHMPETIDVKGPEMMFPAEHWFGLTDNEGQEPRRYFSAVIVMWPSERAFSIRREDRDTV